MLIGGNYSYSNGRNLQYDTFWQIFCIHTFFVRNSGCPGLTESTGVGVWWPFVIIAVVLAVNKYLVEKRIEKREKNNIPKTQDTFDTSQVLWLSSSANIMGVRHKRSSYVKKVSNFF